MSRPTYSSAAPLTPTENGRTIIDLEENPHLDAVYPNRYGRHKQRIRCALLHSEQQTGSVPVTLGTVDADLEPPGVRVPA